MTKASVTQGLVIILSLLDSVCLCMTDLVLQAVLLSVLHLSGICNKNEADNSFLGGGTQLSKALLELLHHT